MKDLKEKWNDLLEEQLNFDQMLKLRGGDGGGQDEDPDQPIVK